MSCIPSAPYPLTSTQAIANMYTIMLFLPFAGQISASNNPSFAPVQSASNIPPHLTIDPQQPAGDPANPPAYPQQPAGDPANPPAYPQQPGNSANPPTYPKQFAYPPPYPQQANDSSTYPLQPMGTQTFTAVTVVDQPVSVSV